MSPSYQKNLTIGILAYTDFLKISNYFTECHSGKNLIHGIFLNVLKCSNNAGFTVLIVIPLLNNAAIYILTVFIFNFHMLNMSINSIKSLFPLNFQIIIKRQIYSFKVIQN